jgi:hypothetical protein
MTAHSTHLVLVPGLACTEDLFAEQIASLRGEITISVADHTRHDTMSTIARAVLATGPRRYFNDANLYPCARRADESHGVRFAPAHWRMTSRRSVERFFRRGSGYRDNGHGNLHAEPGKFCDGAFDPQRRHRYTQ